MILPLDRIKVLDLSSFMAAPVCCMFLAIMGADVIRIEPPKGGSDRVWGLLVADGENLGIKIFARNKKAITLALNTEKGKRIFEKLVSLSDVIVHNYPFGSSLGNEVSYEYLKKINPRIIVAAVSGYGQNGPYADRVSMDFAAQAHSGSMVMNGFPCDPPTKACVPYVDYSTGLTAVLGILFAILYREKTGMGQAVDVSLFDTAFFLTQSTGELVYYEMYKKIKKQLGNSGVFSYQACIEAKDGLVMLTPSTPNIWKRFAKVIGNKDLVADPKFATDMDRAENASLIDPVVQKWASQRTVEEVIHIMQKARVPCAPVVSVDQLLNDPHVAAREMIMDTELPNGERVSLPGIPLKLSLTPGKFIKAAPRIGEHNKEIYQGLLNFSTEELIELQQEGVI
jgi:CoA:oxalate CoA-transferase